MLLSTWKVGLVMALFSSAGCGYAYQCVVPDPPLGAPAAPPLPAHVGVSYPEGLQHRSVELATPTRRLTIPVGAPTISAFNRAAAGLFSEVSGAEGPAVTPGGPDGVLSLEVRDARVEPGGFSPERGVVTMTATLRGRGGEIAEATATAQARGRPVHLMEWIRCDAAGDALASALGEATTRVRDELRASPAVADWIAAIAASAGPSGAMATSGAAPEGALTRPADDTLLQPRRPLAVAVQPPPSERAFRPGYVPRFLELDLVLGGLQSDATGLGGRSAFGWGIATAWDIGEYLALGLRVAANQVRVDWSPNPHDLRGKAENGFAGAELLVRFRPGQLVRPWVGAALVFRSVTWNTYLHAIGSTSLMGSAGLDLSVASFGAVRLGVSYSSGSATVDIGESQWNAVPPGAKEGSSVSMEQVWLTVGWVFDFGPSLPAEPQVGDHQPDQPGAHQER